LEALSWCFPTATNCRGASAVSWWRGRQWLACMSASDVVVVWPVVAKQGHQWRHGGVTRGT
jgi:hypothetical protein